MVAGYHLGWDELEGTELITLDNVGKYETIILTAIEAKLTRQQLFDIFTEAGLMGVYNLGLRHMYEYLNGKK